MQRNLKNLTKALVFSLGYIWRSMSGKTKLYQSTAAADAYARCRPTYNSDVFEAIVSFCQETGTSDFSLAVDVGCGSGQSTIPLTKHFKRVIGLDISQPLVDRAPKDIPNLSFQVGPAEDLSFLEDGCVDLVTAATAMHWMNMEKLYPEVERVLKPGGAFVAYSYSVPTVGEPEVEEIHKYLTFEVLKPYWPAPVEIAMNRYRSCSFPFQGWRRNDSFLIETHWTLDQFVGYLHSRASSQNYLSANPTDNAMDSITERLREAHKAGGERPLKVSWSVFMLMGHKPLS